MADRNEIPVYMPKEEARKFVLFQQYFEPFTTMVDYGVFEVRNGSVSLHFDNKGILQSINRSDILYSARHLSPRQG